MMRRDVCWRAAPIRVRCPHDRPSLPSGGRRLSLASACDTPAEVDETYAAMLRAGYAGHLEPWDAFWGMRDASLLDPDGNGVDRFCRLPSSS